MGLHRDENSFGGSDAARAGEAVGEGDLGGREVGGGELRVCVEGDFVLMLDLC